MNLILCIVAFPDYAFVVSVYTVGPNHVPILMEVFGDGSISTTEGEPFQTDDLVEMATEATKWVMSEVAVPSRTFAVLMSSIKPTAFYAELISKALAETRFQYVHPGSEVRH